MGREEIDSKGEVSETSVKVPPAVVEAFDRAWEREGRRYGEYVVSEQFEVTL